MTDKRSGSQKRLALRQWMLDRFGNGLWVYCCGCEKMLTNQNMTIDRYPVPGKFGGRYTRNNVRPMCDQCNSSHVGEPTELVQEEAV